jgi:ferredoxin-NADP reductase
MRRLDRVIGRVTMYRLVAMVLAVLALVAVVLSLVPDGSAFGPLELLATLATAVIASALSTRLFALVFRVAVHPESSLISGLLIFFLFFPSTEPIDLLVIALIAAIASASKFLLAVRGRHIFNPVAIGALIIGFTGLDAAVWWVGTPYLLAPVLIGGFLVVYRTRRVPMVAVFVLLAVALSTARLASTGTDVGSALWLTVASSPILFFACFMLDEPLTLPPRRWQQLALAGLAALIMQLPFHLGPLYNSPELALVVVNLIAFLMGQRGSVALAYAGSRRLTPTSAEFRFASTRPVSFTPGQYLELSLPHRRADARGARRLFSITSAPGSGEVAIGMSIPEGGSSFKRAIAELPAGGRVLATTIGGDFVLPRDRDIRLLLVAGGIGITPFISQLRHLVQSGERRDIVLVYAVRDASELAYTEELVASAVPVIVVSPTRPASLPEGWQHVEGAYLDVSELPDRVPDLAGRVAYVSGPPAMVSALRKGLRRLGVRRIRADYFTGY